jgi:hypothetical protein
MKEIEVQNKIYPRNIAAFFIIGLVGVINGARDFSIYQFPISKILFPDPVIYEKVVVLNQSVMQSMTVQNSMGFAPSLAALGLFMLAAIFIIGMTAGVMGMGE